MEITPTLKYAWLTIKHKCFVFYAGVKWTKAPVIRLFLHDISKFSPSELPHYGKQFFGSADDPDSFIRAWIHHQNHNPHHWEYWIPRTGHNRCTPPFPDNKPVAMPEWAVREMVADWFGASRAYNGKWPESLSDWEWYNMAYDSIAKRLHPETKQKVDQVIQEAFERR